MMLIPVVRAAPAPDPIEDPRTLPIELGELDVRGRVLDIIAQHDAGRFAEADALIDMLTEDVAQAVADVPSSDETASTVRDAILTTYYPDESATGALLDDLWDVLHERLPDDPSARRDAIMDDMKPILNDWRRDAFGAMSDAIYNAIKTAMGWK